jgi:hypothetical protein
MSQDKFMIELDEFVLRLTIRWSNFNPSYCNNIEVERIAKGRCSDIKFFSKKSDLIFCRELYSVKIALPQLLSPYVHALNLAGM